MAAATGVRRSSTAGLPPGVQGSAGGPSPWRMALDAASCRRADPVEADSVVPGGQLHHPVEDHAAAGRAAPVEPEGELVQVRGQVCLADRSLVSAQQPPLGQRGDPVHGGQQFALRAAGVTRTFAEKVSTRAVARPELDKVVALARELRASGVAVTMVVHEQAARPRHRARGARRAAARRRHRAAVPHRRAPGLARPVRRRVHRARRAHQVPQDASAGRCVAFGRWGRISDVLSRACSDRQRVGPGGPGGGRRTGGGPPGAGPGCPGVAGRVAGRAGRGKDCPASWAAVLACWAGRGCAGGAGRAAAYSRSAAARAAAAWAACCWASRSSATASASAASRVMSMIGPMDRSPVRQANADSSRAAWRSRFPAGDGGGMRP